MSVVSAVPAGRTSDEPSLARTAAIAAFGVAAVLMAVVLPPMAAAGPGPPDPVTDLFPGTIYVVTPIEGAPDVDGANGPSYDGRVPGLVGTNTSNLVVLKDLAGNPRPGIGIHIKFPCDIALCTMSAGPPYTTMWQQTVTCDETGCSLHVVTDANGRAEFVVLGAAKDPGGVGRLTGGGTNNSTIVTVDGYVGTYKTVTTAALDQNGATGTGAGVSALDAAIVLGTALSFPTSDRARANVDGAGVVTALDAAVELGHAFRLAHGSTGGCTGNYAVVAACP